MIDTDAVNAQLALISKRLFRKSLNYSASFKIWKGRELAGKSLEEIMTGTIGEGAIASSYLARTDEILNDIYEGFLYRGDEGSHPNIKLIDSIEYMSEIDGVIKNISGWLEKSHYAAGLHIQNGHPFYPVFWRYAFLIEINRDVYVLIGSSSD